MTLSILREKIETKKATIAVIGLGYVGIPIACEFARVGFNVLGVEIDSGRVDKLNKGISPIEGDEPGLAELLKTVVSQKKFHATTKYAELSDRDIVLIAVETPVDEAFQPRYEALGAALQDLVPVMKSGALVVVESTIAPRTMQDFVLPILESSHAKQLNEDFFLGNCPERVMPGKLLVNLRTVSRVVGGMTPETAETMAALYRHVVDVDLDTTDCLTAELVKTTENAYRDVNIAFANEVALICEAVGGDVWKVRELVNKSPDRNMLLPGAGVGGHCIPKDSWLLVYGITDEDISLRLIPSARDVNDSMPAHIVDLLRDALESQGIKLSDSKLLILGYAYLEDSDDDRNSPTKVLVELLRVPGADVIVHDPHINDYHGDVYHLAKGCHGLVLMVKHNHYRQLELQKIYSLLDVPILIDGRGVFNPEDAKKAGFLYRGIGVGNQP
jgi:UDP-N-acetyl-D-mannosaminuronic acid dehydrogenase